MLYPCETENGEECWLHVPAGQSHLSQRKDEIHAYVTDCAKIRDLREPPRHRVDAMASGA